MDWWSADLGGLGWFLGGVRKGEEWVEEKGGGGILG